MEVTNNECDYPERTYSDFKWPRDIFPDKQGNIFIPQVVGRKIPRKTHRPHPYPSAEKIAAIIVNTHA